MGDRRKQALRVQFDGRLKLSFHGAKLTSDAGLLAFRELDEAFCLTENANAVLCDTRHGKNTQHTLLAMLQQGVYGRLAGYEDVNDAERLRVIWGFLSGQYAALAERADRAARWRPRRRQPDAGARPPPHP